MRLLGYDLSRSSRDPSTSLPAWDGPRDVSGLFQKSLPPGASVNAAGTDTIQRYASTVGSSLPAVGIRPTAGVLPDATKEAETDPLRFQLPWGGNLAYTPRTGYGTPFSILRSLAATSPVIGLCIQCRKDQMASLEWDFAPKNKRANVSDARLQQAKDFFFKPDKKRPHKAWIQLVVDEALTLDAVAIYKRPTKAGAAKIGKNRAYQLAAEEVFSYEVIDGSTIKVLLDDSGDVPPPPNIAYRQIIYGAPVRGGDCTTDQLMYRPKTERTWTPYGMSPIESALLIVTADLNRSMFNLAYYTEGNIPEALVGVPDSWSPKQITQWNEYWDLLMKGDPKNRNRLRFVVQTMAKSIHEFKKPDFTTTYDLWLLKLQCACFGVTPSEIGFTDDVNKATSKTQGDVNQRRGVKPMANYIKQIHDEILADIGLGDIECTWSGGEGEDALTQAKIADLQIRNGSKSLDEIRSAAGDSTLGIGPAIVTASGPQFWDDILAASEAQGVLDTGGDDNPDEPPPPPSSTVEAQGVAQEADLKKFQTVALKAVKAGKPVPAFSSAVIPARVHARLSRALTTAASLDDVKKIFARVRKGQRLTTLQKSHQDQMVRKVTALLAAEGRAVLKHVASGVGA